MDVENSNRLSDTNYRNYFKNSNTSMNTKKFSMETYFVWFSALIFITELITDVCLVVYYFHQREIRWGLMTLAIIILPLMLCQLYSLILFKSQKSIGFSILIVHLLFMGIPYRYHNILRRVDTDKMTNQELENVQQMIHDVKNLQTINAIFQYCPQFIFQAFLIVYKNYKCIITGVSAGLACFSFLWHNFIHFYYYIKKLKQLETSEINTQIIDNLTLSSSTAVRTRSTGVTSSSTSSTTTFIQSCSHNHNDNQNIINDNNSIKNYNRTTNLTENIKIFEKPMYNTDDKNLISKTKQQIKNVEKCSKIFNFNNKRKAVYECDDLNTTTTMINQQQQQSQQHQQKSPHFCSPETSTIFFEINDSCDTTINTNAAISSSSSPSSPSKLLNISNISNKTEDYHNENNINLNTLLMKKFHHSNNVQYNELNYLKDFNNYDLSTYKCNDIINSYNYNLRNNNNGILCNSTDSIIEQRILKRKGICSSQEMLHLVDVMDDIPPEEVDMLAKSLIEMGGEESLIKINNNNHNNNNNNNNDNSSKNNSTDNIKLLETFPEYLCTINNDDNEKIIENIDAVIYENQIIFQERIRKNQLTIQNLKLQDQLLSKYIEEIKNLPSTELINIRDYENMCFANVSRTNRLKHWRNYLQDINTNLHDNSTVQNSSCFYVNTMSNSLTDLYVNSTDIGSVVTEDGKLSDQISLQPPQSSSSLSASINGGGINAGNTNTIGGGCSKKCVRWSEKLTRTQHQQKQITDMLTLKHDNSLNNESDDNLYININGPNIHNTPARKNILVETINAINDVESPIAVSHLCKTKDIKN